jgi:hypothetical protein
MVRRTEAYGWALAIGILAVFAVPWFLWGSSRVAVGLPLWLWWHVGWMGLASVTFYAFARRAWGIGIEAESSPTYGGAGSGDAGSEEQSNAGSEV